MVYWSSYLKIYLMLCFLIEKSISKCGTALTTCFFISAIHHARTKLLTKHSRIFIKVGTKGWTVCLKHSVVGKYLLTGTMPFYFYFINQISGFCSNSMLSLVINNWPNKRRLFETKDNLVAYGLWYKEYLPPFTCSCTCAGAKSSLLWRVHTRTYARESCMLPSTFCCTCCHKCLFLFHVYKYWYSRQKLKLHVQ